MEDYKNFVFYGSWRTLLQSFDKETAKELLYQIMLVGTGTELETENEVIRGIVEGAIRPNIKASQQRYEKAVEGGKKGGRARIELPMEENTELLKSGRTQKEVAELYGVSDDTIRRRLKELSPNRKTAKSENAKPARSQKEDKYIDIDIEKYKKYYNEFDLAFGLGTIPEEDEDALGSLLENGLYWNNPEERIRKMTPAELEKMDYFYKKIFK